MHHREPRTPVIAACLTANFGKVILIASMYGLFILHLPYNITQMRLIYHTWMVIMGVILSICGVT